MNANYSTDTENREFMGAKVTIQGPPMAMYLVIGNGPTASLINMAGGEITMQFTADKLLAVLPYEGFLALKGDRRIRRIGPVNLDMERLKRFAGGIS